MPKQQTQKGNFVAQFAAAQVINQDYHFFTRFAAPPKRYVAAGPLRGHLMSVKDNICTAGLESTAGSAILKGYAPPFNATAVQRALDAGAMLLGKTAMDEFGFGSFSTNMGIGYEMPLNPHDTERVCGGSSGGAAGFAAKASFPHIALAESTGGSIVNPASFCGVVGLCPTYGRVSRWGLIDYASSLDKIGPMAKTIADCALALGVIAGPDGKDATCADVPVPNYIAEMNKPLDTFRIGLLKEGFGKGVQPEVDRAVRDAAKKLGAKGCEMRDVSLPVTMKYGLPCYYILAMAEASTNLAKYCGIRYGASKELKGRHFDEYFSEVRSQFMNTEAKRRVLLGTFARMAGYRDAYYIRAAQVRTTIVQEYQRVFKDVDAILCPTMPMIAPRIDEITKLTPMQNYMMDVLTVGPNVAGLPHLNVPCGTSRGMPIGAMLIGNHWQEGMILRAGAALEWK